MTFDMKLKHLSLIIFITLSVTVSAQNSKHINWTSWKSLEYKMKKNPKKIYVFIYTHNCRWCKKMEITTFKNHEVIDKLNKDYYCVKLYSSTKQKIRYNGKTYNNIYSKTKNLRKIHSLVEHFLGGYYRYPSSLIISENYKELYTNRGSSNIKNFKRILNYF